MASKSFPKIISPTKPPNRSTMTQEETKEIFHQMEQIEKKMGENREHMENNMDQKKDKKNS